MDTGTQIYLLSAMAPPLAALTVTTLVLVATPRKFPQLSLIPFVLFGAFQGATLAIALVSRDPSIAFAAMMASEISVGFIYAAYIIFVSANLQTTPLTIPFRNAPGRIAVILVAVAVGAWMLLAPGMHFVPGPEGGPWFVKTRLHEMVLLGLNMGVIFGLLASIDAFRRAPRGTEARRRAKAYAIAFGVQDVLVTAALILLPSSRPGLSLTGSVLLNAGPALGWFLLAYAMIRAHVFDAELRIRSGVRRGIVASVFLSAFFVVAETMQDYLSSSYGYLLGGLAAGLMLFALHPIQRMAERMANAAMPGVGEADHLSQRKLQVYRAAFESSLSDGHMTEKERRTLATLADQLGISAVQALDVERETRAALGAGVPAAPA